MTVLSAFSFFSCGQAKVSAILDKINSSNENNVDAYIKDLEKTVGNGISIGDAKLILLTVEKKYLTRKEENKNTTLDILRSLRLFDCSKIVDDLFLLSKNVDPEINQEIVFLLSGVDSKKAVKSIFSILDYPESMRPKWINLTKWTKKSIKTNNLFPDILLFGINEKYFYELGLVVLEYCEKGRVKLELYTGYTKNLMKYYEQLDNEEKKLTLNTSIKNWYYNEGYGEIRGKKALVLDLLSFASIDMTKDLLKKAIESKDPRIVYFALSTYIKKGIEVDDRYLKFVADDNEMRKWLFDLLSKYKKDKIKELDFSQEKLAISDMVNWLIFPTELNAAPDEIELIKTVRVDKPKTGAIEYFVFKFRMHEPHWAAKDDWMVGVSGPFIVKNYPTTDSYGETFSSFEKYDGRDAEEYLSNIIGTIKQIK